MMEDSRRMLGLDTFYQGMSDLASELAEDDLRPRGAGGPRAAPLARALAGRLATRLESLQDYSLQVHSLYQESHRRAAEQRHAVAHGGDHDRDAAHLCHRVVRHELPAHGALDVPWGYVAVIAVCVVIVAVEVAFFWHHGWLSFGERRHGGGERRG